MVLCFLAGKKLAELLQSLVKALNAKEIPTGAGLIESFNQEAVNKALAAFVRKMDSAVQLPVNEDVLAQVSLVKCAPPPLCRVTHQLKCAAESLCAATVCALAHVSLAKFGW